MRINRTFLVFSFMFLGSLLCAQIKTISGKVLSSDGQPQSDATVTIQGSTETTYTDESGGFSINAEPGQTIQITSLDDETASFTVNNQDFYDVTLQLSASLIAAKETEIEGVVVTALGIKREKRSLGYSSQQLDAAQINTSPTDNILNNLSGKVAGLDVKTNSNFGGSTNIVLRGTRSLTGNNQALIVVDGVPVNNNNLNMEQTEKGRDGFDFGNSASDIDPNNVESINVLKGAAATALYGSAAANGAIMITTKKGKKEQGLGISLSSTVSIGEIDKETFPDYQKQYGAGYAGPNSFYYEDVNGDGIVDILAPTGDDASFGAAFDPNLLVYQWNAFAEGNPNYGKPTPWTAAKNDPSKFFQNSYSFINSINLNGGDEKNTYNFTYTNNNETGIMPNSKLNKNMINGNFSRDFSDKLKATAFLSYTNQSVTGRNSVGYGDNILTGFRQWWPLNVDILELKQEYFRNRQNVTWNMNDPVGGNYSPAYWNNPYWDRYQNYTTDSRNRILAGTSLSYDITKDLNLLGRVTVDYSTDRQELRKAVGSHSEEFGIKQGDETSGYWLFTQDQLSTTYDLIASYDLKIAEQIGAKFLGGGTFMKSKLNGFEGSTTGGLIIPNKYTLSNSNVNAAPKESELHYEKSGIYAQASFDYSRLWFIEGSIRRDMSTALFPKNGNNDYAYFSAGTSLVFSDLIRASWLSFGKIRGSYAEVGNDPEPGRHGYKLFGLALGDDLTGYNDDTFVDFENLKPERTKSWEVGLEAILLKNRISFDVALYKTNTVDLLFGVPVSTATGYDYEFANAGETENKGIEVLLNLVPIKTGNFEWKITANWSKNKNMVIDLGGGRDNLQLARFQQTSLNATKGQPYGTIRGTDYTYDHNGNKIVNEKTGTYLISQDKVIGNIQPEWTGGITNKFTYKNFSLGFLIDIKKGGDVFSLDQSYGQETGLYKNTTGLNDLGNPVRNPLSEGGGVILPGVKQDFNPDGTPKIDNDGNLVYVTNDVRLDTSEFGGFGTGAYPQKDFVYDASYVKLREVSITYSLPAQYLKGTFIKGASFSVIGNNLWIIHKNLPDADPEAGMSSGNIQGYQSGVMPTTRIYSFNVKFNF
ncbi:MAG: SusC/RagA family TonB-linked outer membrane protein [Flavobacteriaceae bacterium]|jgi:TonB-linked SusC/RagA family outer membrane protein|nr:SusC/RagA family TonB-linked outer membrane protein [Flavobacteriaceae bacterium]